MLNLRLYLATKAKASVYHIACVNKFVYTGNMCSSGLEWARWRENKSVQSIWRTRRKVKQTVGFYSHQVTPRTLCAHRLKHKSQQGRFSVLIKLNGLTIQILRPALLSHCLRLHSNSDTIRVCILHTESSGFNSNKSPGMETFYLHVRDAGLTCGCLHYGLKGRKRFQNKI